MTMSAVHDMVKDWIADVLKANPGPVSIALRQRAKFEGWLKFALAAHAELKGAANVEVEASTSESGPIRTRSDLSFRWDGARYDIELKTPNTNWRMPGVGEKTRPITKNFSSIVEDAKKLFPIDCQLLVAFVIFPIPRGDHRWRDYLERIGHALPTPLTLEAHATQVTLPISEQHSADVVICCFPVSRRQDADQLAQAAV